MAKKADTYTNYKKAIDSKNVILLAQSGSHVLGMNDVNSDVDTMAVYVENIKDGMGFIPQDGDLYRTATDRTGIRDAKSESGDIDLTLYGLRKFLKLALGGNPNLMNTLFAPEDKCAIRSYIGAELQALAPKIVSKQTGKAFLGYLHAQRLRLLGSRGQKAVNRPELELKFGYDTHYAMHMVRLGYQGVELMQTGKLTLPLISEHRTTLRYIKTGQYGMDKAVYFCENLEQELKNLIEYSKLPDQPDYDSVEKWMLGVYMNTWKKEYENTKTP